jgi:hypothetical protein
MVRIVNGEIIVSAQMRTRTVCRRSYSQRCLQRDDVQGSKPAAASRKFATLFDAASGAPTPPVATAPRSSARPEPPGPSSTPAGMNAAGDTGIQFVDKLAELLGISGRSWTTPAGPCIKV